MTTFFWLQFAAIAYAYAGYPLLLRFLVVLVGRRPPAQVPSGQAWEQPTVTLIIPVHNEESVIGRKLDNLTALLYPPAHLQVLIVSDGSTDRTAEIVRSRNLPGVLLLELPERGGKARALNHALRHSTGELVCFSDASIMLEPGALQALAANFRDPHVGCASGEDGIVGGGEGGERLYGMYELGIRRLESRLCSIVGASGSFYAQRRVLCEDFPEGLAPDFLSVLNTVQRGFRAVSDPAARGTMTSLSSSKAEFQRKVRTILRGMATLFSRPRLLNPFRYGWFALELFSHKVMRWAVPFFMLLLLSSNLLLLQQPLYAALLVVQVAFYALAYLGWRGVPWARNSLFGKIAVYFTVVNLATLVAWWRFAQGARQEIWDPTRRESPES
jgi:cellulose synthase/poly-beta-1,6-N-acetylglucosamine synthase-like glycosyltransferase